jgi:PAS domain S-box-containing protein
MDEHLNSSAFLKVIRSNGYSVRACLIGIVATILIPALMFGGWMITRSTDSERALLERNSEAKGRQVLVDIEHEIQLAKAMLIALASSQFLQTENFQAFHEQSAEVAKQLGSQVVLTDANSGQQIVNAAIPWGQSPPRNIPTQASDARKETTRSGTMVVSNVFFGPALKKYIVSLGIPVTKDGAVAYYLATGIPVDTFADALQNAALPAQWVVTLIDRDNTIVARSERHSEVAGSKLLVDLAGGTAAEGASTGTDRYGIAYRWTWHRSKLTGWLVAVGVPLSVLEAPARAALINYAAASGALLIIAMTLSFYVGGHLPEGGKLGIDRQPTREEFQLLFDTAPNGVLVVDSNGIIILVNARMETKFGYAREELIGQTVELLLPERFREGHAALRRAFSHSPTSRPMAAGCELYGQRKDGSELAIEIGLNPISTNTDILIMATVVDISARKQAAARLAAAADALLASEQQRQLAIEAAELGTWTWDFAGDQVWWSDRLRKILSVPNTIAASYTNYLERVHPSDQHLIMTNRDRWRAGQNDYDHEYRIVGLNDRATRWVNSKGRIVCDESGKPLHMHGVIQDITARRAAEHARDDLRRSLMQAQENERLRLARELHDQTGQSIAAMMLELKAVEATVGEGGRSRLRLLRDQLEQMGRVLHRVAWELRPASIDEVGLATGLANYISEWGSQFGIETDFVCSDSHLNDLAEEMRTAIYRVVQEALTNIAKHATGTTSVSIVISRVDAVLQLTIEDNGSGFDSAAPTVPARGRLGGLGLAGMRERLTLIGGNFDIESSVGAGTTVFVRIPLDQERLIA